MSHKDRGLSVCPGTVLSVLSLLLYSAGFIRIEVQLNDYDGRLMAVEEAVVRMKQEVTQSSNEDSFMNKSSSVVKHQRSARSVSSPSLVNETADIKQVLEDILTTSLKIRQQQRNKKCCAPGRPGPPGRAGAKGDKGDQGRRGRGGNMGQPGKSGKQGIMGPPGKQSEKGIKGDIGPPGLAGMKGERGINGDIGPPGLAGMKGERGIKGDIGPPGLPGKGVCNAVGVADRNKIPDDKMTASTLLGSDYHPYFGRLNETRGGGAWCPKTRSDRTDFLQVDMGSVHTLCAVATQGYRGGNDYAKSYKLHLSTDGITWNAYKVQNTEKVFPGNTHGTAVVKNILHVRTKARFVRFYPVTNSLHPCLRVEIFVWD